MRHDSPSIARGAALIVLIAAAAAWLAARPWAKTVGPAAPSSAATAGAEVLACCGADGDCGKATSPVRSADVLVPVASAETPDDAMAGHAQGAATQFDEQCRPVPAVASDRPSGAASSEASPLGASSAPGSPHAAVAPTPAPPDLAHAQPQRFVLMVEVEAQHGPTRQP